MQSITTEEYEATCKWLKSKIDVYGETVSINDVKIPLEWILELVENSKKESAPMNAEQFWQIPNTAFYDEQAVKQTMTTKECIDVAVKECIKFADCLDYLAPDEFTESEIITSLESSNTPEAKQALAFLSNSSYETAQKLFDRISRKLVKYIDKIYG